MYDIDTTRVKAHPRNKRNVRQITDQHFLFPTAYILVAAFNCPRLTHPTYFLAVRFEREIVFAIKFSPFEAPTKNKNPDTRYKRGCMRANGRGMKISNANLIYGQRSYT